MTTLNLGVIDIPHVEPPSTGKKPAKSSNETTGDLATILENKYHIMEIFFQLHAEDIADALADSAKGAIESLMMGGPAEQYRIAQSDISKTAMSKIEKMFRDFLTNKEMDALGIPGVPTKASLEGISHRFKGKRGAPGRPSFVDTGQFEAAFKAWMEA